MTGLSFQNTYGKQSRSFTTIFVYDADNLLETLNASGSEVASYPQTQKIDDTPAELRSSTTDYYKWTAEGPSHQ